MATQTGSYDFKTAKQAKESAEATASADATNKANDAKKYATNFLASDSSGIMIYDASSGIQTPTSPSANTKNVFIDSDSVDVRQGTTVLATFGADGATLGETVKTHSVIDSSGLHTYAEDGTTPIAHLGYGVGTAEQGTSTKPYYTFGERSGTIGNYSLVAGKSFIAHDATTGETETTPLIASGFASVAIGLGCNASGYNSFASGCKTVASGTYSYSEGNSSVASSGASHAEGASTTASGLNSHAENTRTTASGTSSHAEGESTTAEGKYSHAEGYSTTAKGDYSHTEGQGVQANGSHSHAEGRNTLARGVCSHAQNIGTYASDDYQTTIGKYNAYGSVFTNDCAFIIGNGSGLNNRSNAFGVSWGGDTYLALDTSAQSGDDYNLYTEITTLGWQNDVLV